MLRVKPPFGVDFVRKMLYYNKRTGVFLWKQAPSSWYETGKRADRKGTGGYRVIRLNKRDYFVHRIAWLYVTGSWPRFFIDHLNGKRADNRWTNLREATLVENLYNQKRSKNNKSGIKGVSWDKRRKKWRAVLVYNRGFKHLGYYEKKADAGFAYVKAAKEYFKNFWRLD